MENRKTKPDYILAQKICNELRSGNREAVLDLYYKYNRFFTVFARKRLFRSDPNEVETVLTNFWVELLNTSAICGFEGKASLRTYLTIILNRRIIDRNRDFERKKNSDATFKEHDDEIMNNSFNQRSPEDKLIKKEQQKLIHDALLQLAVISPRDASLIRMHLTGMTYEEMAEKELHANEKHIIKIKKKTDAIKKQFSRDKTGTMAKFRSVLIRCLEKNALCYKDLFN
jgi:RNA polymerase sigma-70 factor (ECF subfamily)